MTKALSQEGHAFPSLQSTLKSLLIAVGLGERVLRLTGNHVSGKIMFLYSCFSANTVEQIIENLRQDGSPFAIEQMKVTYGSFLSRLTMDTLGQGSRSGGCQ